MLTLTAVAVFCGVVRGKKDPAAFARTLSDHQLRALRFRRDKKTGKPRCPGVTTFFRILNEVDEIALELALLAWQNQVLGPVQDRIIALDGKALRHSQGGELVSALGAESGRWLGTVRSLRQDLAGHHQCRSKDLERQGIAPMPAGLLGHRRSLPSTAGRYPRGRSKPNLQGQRLGMPDRRTIVRRALIRIALDRQTQNRPA